MCSRMMVENLETRLAQPYLRGNSLHTLQVPTPMHGRYYKLRTLQMLQTTMNTAEHRSLRTMPPINAEGHPKSNDFTNANLRVYASTPSMDSMPHGLWTTTDYGSKQRTLAVFGRNSWGCDPQANFQPQATLDRALGWGCEPQDKFGRLLSWGCEPQATFDRVLSWGCEPQASFQPQATFGRVLSWGCAPQATLDRALRWGCAPQATFGRGLSWGCEPQVTFDRVLGWGCEPQATFDDVLRWGCEPQPIIDRFWGRVGNPNPHGLCTLPSMNAADTIILSNYGCKPNPSYGHKLQTLRNTDNDSPDNSPTTSVDSEDNNDVANAALKLPTLGLMHIPTRKLRPQRPTATIRKRWEEQFTSTGQERLYCSASQAPNTVDRYRTAASSRRYKLWTHRTPPTAETGSSDVNGNDADADTTDYGSQHYHGFYSHMNAHHGLGTTLGQWVLWPATLHDTGRYQRKLQSLQKTDQPTTIDACDGLSTHAMDTDGIDVQLDLNEARSDQISGNIFDAHIFPVRTEPLTIYADVVTPTGPNPKPIVRSTVVDTDRVPDPNSVLHPVLKTALSVLTIYAGVVTPTGPNPNLQSVLRAVPSMRVSPPKQAPHPFSSPKSWTLTVSQVQTRTFTPSWTILFHPSPSMRASSPQQDATPNPLSTRMTPTTTTEEPGSFQMLPMNAEGHPKSNNFTNAHFCVYASPHGLWTRVLANNELRTLRMTPTNMPSRIRRITGATNGRLLYSDAINGPDYNATTTSYRRYDQWTLLRVLWTTYWKATDVCDDLYTDRSEVQLDHNEARSDQISGNVFDAQLDPTSVFCDLSPTTASSVRLDQGPCPLPTIVFGLSTAASAAFMQQTEVVDDHG